MTLEELRHSEEDAILQEIDELRGQIKAKQNNWPAIALGAVGALVGWKIAGTWPATFGCALLAAGLTAIAFAIERAILHTRLEGVRTRLAILRLRSY